MDNTAILAVIEALGESLAAHKNYEENIRAHVEQLHEQNEMLRKEVRDLKAQNEAKDRTIKELDLQSKAMMNELGATVEETYADEECTIPLSCKADDIPITVDTNSYANNCEACDC